MNWRASLICGLAILFFASLLMAKEQTPRAKISVGGIGLIADRTVRFSIARLYGETPPTELDSNQIEDGALLHDIGKLRIPDSILLKPGSLSPSEWKVMRCHAEYGRQFLERIESLSGASQIVYAHHEKFNGKGYPRGLKGDEIPIGARCFAIVDAVDALIYERPYHKAISFDMASDEIKRCAGTHFDPELIGVALDHIAARLPQSSAAQAVN